MSEAMKASFPNPINLDELMHFISDNMDPNKLSSCMAAFGIPVGYEKNKDKFVKAIAIQFSRFVINAELDISNDVWEIYESLLNGEEISSQDIRGPRYAGDVAVVFSKKNIESNCYEQIHCEWEIQNQGKIEWRGRKLVFMNQDEIDLEILQRIIPIPDTKTNKTIKIGTDIIVGGSEGAFECKWEMQDENSQNCFENHKWEFNKCILVRFKEDEN